DQKKLAHRKEKFPEPKAGTTVAKVGDPVGLPASMMTKEQKGTLLKLLQHYTDRMAPEVGQAQLAAARKAGLEKVHFAYQGGVGDGQEHTYRVQGPTFVIEFLNNQPDGAKNPANHIHSVWRNLAGDFGITKE